MFKRRFPLFDLAGDTGGGGGSAAPAAAPAPAAAAPAPGGDAGGGTGTGGSLLQQGLSAAVSAPAAAPAAAGSNDWLLEQHHVKGADGTLDEAASTRKQAEAYKALYGRMRSDGAPPAKAEEYKFEVPEAIREHYDSAKDPLFATLREKAFEAGLTQKQYEAVMGTYAGAMPEIIGNLFEQKFEAGEKALREHWKTDAAFQGGLRDAATAVKGFTPGAFDAQGNVTDPQLVSLMNNPYFLRFAAHFGAQMHEDVSPTATLPAGSPFRGMGLQQLERHEAYTNARHPDHAEVSRLVREMYSQKFGEDPAG